jgi:putative NADH-flavin reductase
LLSGYGLPTCSCEYAEEVVDLLVVGAAGRTGRLIVEEALAAGHVVTAFVRRPDALGRQHDRLTVVQGDVLNAADVAGAIKGKGAVLSALGVKGRGPTTVFSAGMANVLAAMEAHGVRRVVAISTAGLDPDPDVPLAMKLVSNLIVARMFRNLYRDQTQMEKVLAASDTDWTVVRATMLTDKPATGTYRAGEKLSRPERIGRADLAAYLLACLDDPQTIHKKVMISY